MSVKRRCSTRWGHPYHLQGACTEWRQTLLHPLCSITPMTPEDYTEYFAQSKREDTSESRAVRGSTGPPGGQNSGPDPVGLSDMAAGQAASTVSYTHLRAHETPEHLVCRLL